MTEHWIIKCCMIGMIAITSCYYDNEEELYPPQTCDTVNVSLQNTLMPILDRSCYTCHSAAVNSGNVTLEGYSELVKYANNGRLLGAMRHDSGFKAMPQNAPQLSDCDITKFEHWISDGVPNN